MGKEARRDSDEKSIDAFSFACFVFRASSFFLNDAQAKRIVNVKQIIPPMPPKNS